MWHSCIICFFVVFTACHYILRPLSDEPNSVCVILSVYMSVHSVARYHRSDDKWFWAELSLKNAVWMVPCEAVQTAEGSPAARHASFGNRCQKKKNFLRGHTLASSLTALPASVLCLPSFLFEMCFKNQDILQYDTLRSISGSQEGGRNQGGHKKEKREE